MVGSVFVVFRFLKCWFFGWFFLWRVGFNGVIGIFFILLFWNIGFLWLVRFLEMVFWWGFCVLVFDIRLRVRGCCRRYIGIVFWLKIGCKGLLFYL